MPAYKPYKLKIFFFFVTYVTRNIIWYFKTKIPKYPKSYVDLNVIFFISKSFQLIFWIFIAQRSGHFIALERLDVRIIRYLCDFINKKLYFLIDSFRFRFLIIVFYSEYSAEFPERHSGCLLYSFYLDTRYFSCQT